MGEREVWVVSGRFELADDEPTLLSGDGRVAMMSRMLAGAHGGDASPTLRGWIGRVEVVAGGEVFNLQRAGIQGQRWIEGAAQAVGLPPAAMIELNAMNARDFHGALDVVGAAELAEMLQVSRQRLVQLRGEGVLPEPDVALAATPVWMRSTVEGFLWGWRRRPGPAPKEVDMDRLVSGQ